ncbi:MAG: penicillin-binding protein activator [Rickettsiaceae bacterium]
MLVLISCSNVDRDYNDFSEAREEVVEIAILMPMTGPHAKLGQEYNKMIKMGLHDEAKTHIRVTSYDGSDEVQVMNAMKTIIERDTDIILGPLYSKLTSIISKQAQEHNIIIMTMSNDPSIADDNIFVFGHAPLKQIMKIVNHLLANQHHYFITLLPANEYSSNIAKIVQDIMVKHNAVLARAEFYEDTPESIIRAVGIVTSTVDNINEMDDQNTKPVILVSDNSQNLQLLYEVIDRYNLDKKAVIIGDNSIDIENAKIDMTFVGSSNIFTSDVKDKGEIEGITHLSFMDALAYDLGRMAAYVIGYKFSPQSFLSRIYNSESFAGISGNIFYQSQPIAQRQYDIISKQNGVYTTIRSN